MLIELPCAPLYLVITDSETDLNISFGQQKGWQEGAHLLQGKDDKGSPAAGVDDDGNKFGVDGAEGAVPRDPGHADVIVALVVPHRLAENVTELALSHNSPHHICGHIEKSDDTPHLSHLLAQLPLIITVQQQD